MIISAYTVPLRGPWGPERAMKQDHYTETADQLDARAVIAEHHAFIRTCVRMFGRKYSGAFSDDDLDDITQSVFERILASGLRSYRGDCPVEGYLAVIVRNLIFDRLRKIKKDRAALVQCDDDAPGRAANVSGAPAGNFERELEERDLSDFVKAEAARLPGKQAIIFMMIARDDMTQQETARALGLRQSTVSEHYAKARKLIQAAVKKRYPDAEFT